MSKGSEALAEMEKQVNKYRKAGRCPLFVLGAGISATKVPVMKEIFEELEKSLKLFAESCTENNLRRKIDAVSDDAYRLANDSLYQSRAVASKFFGILQQQEECKGIWKSFTADFLMGLKGRDPIWDLKPTSFHSYVAKQIVTKSVPAVCLSLNYDGLTAKAIVAEAKRMTPAKEFGTLDPLYPCRILTTAEEIQNYYHRNAYHLTDASCFYPLIKLRGDIFNAVCDNEECKHFGQRTPLYEIEHPAGETEGKLTKAKARKEDSGTLFPSLESEDKRKAYGKTIKCKGCGTDRKIELDFPAYRAKELEVQQVVEELCRYVVPSLGCVVVCGVSGRWDPALVEFLRACAEQRDLEVYCIDMDKQPAIKTQLNLRGAKRDRFIHIELDMSTFGEQQVEQ